MADEALPGISEPLEPEIEELWSSRALLLVLLLLILSFWTAYYLKRHRIRSIHETIVALFAGMFVGLCIRVLPGVVVQGMLAFKHTILLNVLLPPIILNSGFELRQENFFRNFATILTFAFAGTFISAVVLGVLVYIWALLGLEGLSLTIVECLQFGSTLSATDPVTILAIFNSLKVDPKLYSVIFGESILNDAVAIVMYETLSQFHGEKIHVLSFFHGVGIFLLVFLCSMALGVIFGLGCSLLLKHSQLARFPEIETCLVLLLAYTSYFLSNALTMSGIVSLLFCGITLKHYAYHNMSRKTQRTTRYMFATLAQLCENFIFIYLGLSLFTSQSLVYKPIFILVTALGVCVARYAAVFPISKIINLVARSRGQQQPELPHSYQMMLFWAGLRGAVGVALAAGLHGENGNALKTTVLVAVVLTMIVFGGTTTRMIEIVGIRTGVEEDDDESDDEANGLEGGGHHAGWQKMNGRYPMKANPYESNTSHHRTSSSSGKGNDLAHGPYRDRHFSDSSNQLPHSSSALSLAESAESYDDPDILPSANPTAAEPSSASLASGMLDAGTAVWRDGQWFNVLDERYLLPVFSNATASRKQASRKAARKSRTSLAQADTSGEFESGDIPSGPPTPSDGARSPSRNIKESDLTFHSVLSELLVSPATPLGPDRTESHRPATSLGLSQSQTHKRRESGDAPPLSAGFSGGSYRANNNARTNPQSGHSNNLSLTTSSASTAPTTRRASSHDETERQQRRSYQPSSSSSYLNYERG